jgi:hypothetical protein
VLLRGTRQQARASILPELERLIGDLAVSAPEKR